jgi:hypothetical protein
MPTITYLVRIERDRNLRKLDSVPASNRFLLAWESHHYGNLLAGVSVLRTVR